MKLIKIFTAAVLLTGAGSAFAKSPVNNTVNINRETEDRHISGFTAISASGSLDVYIVQGATESVRVEAPADVMRYIITEVKNGTLNIHDKSHTSWHNLFSSNKKIAVYVSVKAINGIDIIGSGDVFFKEGISANLLRLHVTGSGDVVGKLNVKTLESNITGSGDIKLSGHADNLKVGVSGSGDFSARGLTTINTTARVSGSGDVDVNVSGSLDANVSGSGDIRYSGSPKNVNRSKSGSGDISGH
ncbi:MAG: hypothetical protein JWQ79_3630 [Mucilaginibacter sp.]|jgi:hypothetical protein|nr:hypothetical protein [Mucilaginibacter sp.]